MLRGSLLVGLATMILAAVPAQAGVSHGDDENEYEGRVDRNPGLYFGFDLNDAKTRVRGITAYIGYECKKSGEVPYTLVEASGSLKLNAAKEFAGTVSYEDNDDGEVRYAVKGKLRSQGRASGTIKGQFFEPSYDGPCLGGGDWRALKGRDIDS